MTNIRLAVLTGLIVFPLLGCRAKPAANVQLRNDSGVRLSQAFDRAAFTKSPTGEYDIILVTEPAGASRAGRRRTGGLDSARPAPVTHTLHVRVLWRPVRSIRGESPTATNASVQWTVLGAGSDRVDYTGAGFAQAYGDDDQILVTLRNIQITPTSKQGAINDPIGAATLYARFKARRDKALVSSALATIRPPIQPPAGSNSASVGYEGPPPRPVGP